MLLFTTSTPPPVSQPVVSLLALSVRIIAVASAYYITGFLALKLALPPGFASPIFPAAGIALVAVLLGGSRLALGVALGSWFMNLTIAHQVTGTITSMLTIATLAVGLGAAAQALLGVYMIHRLIGPQIALDQISSIAKFFLLGGVISTLLSPTIGVSNFWLAGMLNEEFLVPFWLTWWLGDSFGVIVTTPILLSFFAEPKTLWRRRLSTVALPLALVFTTVLFLLQWSQGLEEKNRALAFTQKAQTLTHLLQKQLDESLELVHSLKRWHNSTDNINRESFRTYSEDALVNHAGLWALSRSELVRLENRQQFETKHKKEIDPTFRLWEINQQGRITLAADRPFYAVVTQIEPYAKNEMVLGFDIMSEPLRAAALSRARDSGNITATAPLMLLDADENGLGILIFHPLYRHRTLPDSLSERRHNLTGFVSAAMRVSDVVNSAFQGIDISSFDIQLADTTDRENPIEIYRHGQAALKSQPADLEYLSSFGVAGREWSLKFNPSAFEVAHLSAHYWLQLGAGVLFVALLGAFLLVVTGQTAQVERLVTERTAELHHARLATEASEQRFRLLVLHAPVGIVQTDQNGKCFYVNERWTELSGQTIEQAADQGWIEAVHPEDRDEVIEKWLHAKNTEEEVYLTFRLQDPSTMVRYVRNRAAAIYGDDGELLSFLLTFSDITESILSEARLQENFNLLQAITEGTNDAVFAKDINGRYIMINQAGCRLLGKDKAEIIGRRDADLSSSDYVRLVEQVDLEVMHTLEVKTFETTSQLPTGERHLIMSKAAYLDAQGKAIGVVGVAHDITERKRAEEKVRHSLTEKEILLKEVYHRVKNNMQIVASLLALQARNLHDPQAKQALEDSSNRVKSMALIHEKLYRSKDLANVDFGDYLKNLADHLLIVHQAYANNISIKTQAANLFLAIDIAIPCGLIINELVINAMKHAFPQGRAGEIVVSAEALEGGKVMLVVNDNGIGLPENLDFTRSKSLGLQLVNTLTGQLLGKVSAERNDGTRFVVRFPELD